MTGPTHSPLRNGSEGSGAGRARPLAVKVVSAGGGLPPPVPVVATYPEANVVPSIGATVGIARMEISNERSPVRQRCARWPGTEFCFQHYTSPVKLLSTCLKACLPNGRSCILH